MLKKLLFTLPLFIFSMAISLSSMGVDLSSLEITGMQTGNWKTETTATGPFGERKSNSERCIENSTINPLVEFAKNCEIISADKTKKGNNQILDWEMKCDSGSANAPEMQIKGHYETDGKKANGKLTGEANNKGEKYEIITTFIMQHSGPCNN